MNCLVHRFATVRTFFILPLFLLFSFAAIAQTATLTTDQDDYPPGSTATITGNGFQPGETVLMQVVRTDNNNSGSGNPDFVSWTVVADQTGHFVTTWYVCDGCLGATLLATADGQSSGLHADVIFTDGNLLSISVGSQLGSLTYGNGGTVSYVVTFTATGQGNTTADINNITLPSGVTAFWKNGDPFTFNGSSGVDTLILTVASGAKIPVLSPFTFTVSAGSRSSSGKLTTTKRALTVSAAGVNKSYDGNTTTTVTLSDNRVSGDVLADAYTTATFADKNVGTGKIVSVFGISISGTDTSNYSLQNTTAATTANITSRSLTVSATGVNKPYDGNTTATVTLSDNRVSGDALTDAYTTAIFANKNVGTGKTVSVSGISISGTDAGNYSLQNTTAAITANITSRALTVSATGVNKPYDGNTTATVTLSDNRVSGDALTDAYTSASFSDKNVGTGKTVSVSGISISGTDAGNYTFNTTASTTADITVKTLTISAAGVNKVYNGTAAATVTLSDNRVSGDALTDVYTTATFADKNVGSGKTVSVSGISISGTDAGNYTFNTTASTTADITAMALTISAAGVNKVYDGTTAATVTLSDNRVSGDALTDAYTSASFSDKNVGIGKTVSVSGISISGTDAGNYTFNTTASTTADITAMALTISAAGVNKVYDGTTAATVTLSDNRVSGDVLADAYTTATFADKNVGTGKAVSVSGISISGTDAGNYNFNTTASTTADITVKTLTISAAGVNKVYDGTTAATVTLSDNRVSGDALTDAYTTATFADKNVGTGKTVSVSGISISGTDAGNYTFNTTASTTADITAMALTISAAGVNKVYDGTTAATVTLSDNRVSGDALTDAYTTATFADKNVGTGKTVSVSGISISGADAGNYTFNTTASTTADITVKTLTISAAGVNKVYDGTAAATVTLSDNRVSGDALTDAYTSASFSDKNVGTGKTVFVSGISISGADAGNYTFNITTSTTADITAKTLAISAAGVNKVYDGTAAATVTLSDNRVSGDALTDAYTTATFADKNVGTGKTVSVSGISISGADAGNYTFNTTTSTTADITAMALTISAAGVNKVYDGTSAATVTLSDNRVSGDVLADAYTSASFSDKNVGTGKTVSVSGISISGTDAGNYTFNTTASTTADITAKTLAISAAGVNKVYDGTTAATVTLSDNRVSGDALTDAYTSASFSDKNLGTGKTVSVSGISISGSDAGNYTFNTTASTTADITAKALTISAAGVNKVYDGTTAATVTLSDNRVSGDALTNAYTSASFSDKNVGIGKTVSVSGISISGTDAGNYTFNTTASTTADITAKVLTITAAGVNKVYDGNTTATVTLSDNRVSGDVLADAYTTATFADKNVGAGKTVSVSGISISGADAGNYTFNTTASTTADITAKALTISAAGENKVYDGTTAATVTLSDNRVSGDVLTGAYTSASFSDKNVGTGKTVSVSGISISGTDAGNYTFNTTTSTTADITAKTLTISAAGVNKVYDGTTAATVTLSDNRVSGDVLADAYTTATFADKNVGAGKTVSVSGISISGTDAGNYSLQNTTAATTANITSRALLINAAGVNKVYDGNATATVTLSDNRVSGDVFTDAYTSASFNNKNVGAGKPVSVSGISIAGTDAGNYTANTSASTSANITALAITGNITASNKIYDGNTTAMITGRSLSGAIGGDAVSYTGGTAAFSNKNVGSGKLVTATGLSLTGTDAYNYTVNTTATTTADITTRSVTASVNASNKAYDGNTIASATGSIPSGIISGDAVNVIVTNANFANATIGTWMVTTNVGLGGAQSGNYALTANTATTTASITPYGVTTSIYVGTNPQQYSDVATYTARIAAGAPLVVNGPQAAQSVTFKVGTQIIAANVAFTVSGADLVVTYTGPLLEPTPFGSVPTGQMSPGAHTVTASISGADPNFSLSNTNPTTTLNILPEDARITYTGALNVATTTSTSTTAIVTLVATIQDITATPDVAGDNSYGDIRNATVTFINRDNNTIIASNVPVGLVNPGDTKTGTAVYNWSNVSVGQYTIGVIVNNYYGRSSSADNQVINVYQANGDFITGGGYITLTNSNGLKAGDAGSRNNFGFNVKYNKSGTNLQGNINVIIRRTEGGVVHTYQVKGNSMTSLSVNPNSTTTHPNPTAVFNGKANIQDITNPLSPVSVDGNGTLQVNMTDAGDPGSSDKIGMVVYNKSGGVWFSSYWNGTSTVEQTLGGGNLVVHGSAIGSGTTARTTDVSTQATTIIPASDHFDVKVLGNPAVMYFTVLVESSRNEAFEMKIYDITGRQIQTVRGMPGTQMRIGEAFMKGQYILEIKQGNHYKTVTLVKI